MIASLVDVRNSHFPACRNTHQQLRSVHLFEQASPENFRLLTTALNRSALHIRKKPLRSQFHKPKRLRALLTHDRERSATCIIRLSMPMKNHLYFVCIIRSLRTKHSWFLSGIYP